MLASNEQLTRLGRIVLEEAARAHDWYAATVQTSKHPRMSLVVAKSILLDARSVGIEIGQTREADHGQR